MFRTGLPLIRFRVGEGELGRYVECYDNGVGMGDHELREAFAKAGRRFRDLPEFVEEAAEWEARGESAFHPISQFGIGVLSYFMIADRLELWTTRCGRDLRLRTPLHVRVHGGGGLFRVEAGESVRPPNGGTIVRLHLRKDFQTFDVEKALRDIIQAPTVCVVYGEDECRWEAGHLYRDGAEVTPCHAVPGTGVFFHEGAGSILIKGMPISSAGNPLGFTISLDGRTRPHLTVDRRNLLNYGRPLALVLLHEAAAHAGDWADANVNWLLDLFDYEKAFAEGRLPLQRR